MLDKELKDVDPNTLAEQWATAIFNDALLVGASDVHIDPHRNGMILRFRVDGVLHDVHKLESGMAERLIRYFKVNSGLSTSAYTGPEDAHLEFKSQRGMVDVRVASAPCLNGDKMTLRLLPRTQIQLGLEELGLADGDLEQIHDWLNEVTGMFLVCGPTGSGKTTTLHAILKELLNKGSSIVTIEEPAEYRVEGLNQIEVDQDVGLTFPNGLRTALRLDPDQILLGEIRDEESAKTSMRAACTGHTIFSSMHGSSAAGVTTALRSFGLTDQEIAPSLAFVISQRLVRKLCPHCKQEVTPDKRIKHWLRRHHVDVPDKTWIAGGCAQCHQSGYKGRTGIFELWPINEEAYAHILRGEDEHRIRNVLRKSGIRSLLQDGLEKASQGITSLSELRSVGFLSPVRQVASDE